MVLVMLLRKAWVLLRVILTSLRKAGLVDVDIDYAALAVAAVERMHALVTQEKDCARGMGLLPSEMRALNILAVYPAPMRLTELCDRAGLASNLGLRSISTLRKRELVIYAQSQTDRRAMEVALSPTGLNLIEKGADGFVEMLEGVFPGKLSIGPGSLGIAESR